MKLPIFAVLLFLVVPATHAALVDWDTLIDINEDKTTEWKISFVYDEPVARTDYFIPADVTDYSVTGDGKPLKCKLTIGPGSLILCDNIRAKDIVYKIKTARLANDILQRFRLFSQKLSVTQPTKAFSVTVKLPLGAGLAEENQLLGTALRPFEPEFGAQDSDGRRIFVIWRLDNPVIGNTLFISVVYEQFSEQIEFALFGIIIVAALAAFAIFIFVTHYKPVQSILPVLTNSERKVVEILLREKKEVDQRAIVKETDFSKAQVSRIISDLVNRGVVEKVSKGRKNIIRLNKAVKAGKTTKSESKIKEPK